MKHESAVCLHLESTIAEPPELGHHLVEMELRMERLDLFEQPGCELMPRDDRQCRNVIDRLFGVEFGALPARPVENINDVAFNVEQAEFENRKQAAWAATNNHRVGG